LGLGLGLSHRARARAAVLQVQKKSPGLELGCVQRTSDGQGAARAAVADTAVVHAALDGRRRELCAGELSKAQQR